ncbi:MAG: FAD-binding protein [Chloroflexota bacterium]|nr:FAD-binding protein [Chloroflexota bacterium]
MPSAGTVAGRTIEGDTPSTFATVTRARELLHGGEEALTPLARDLAAGLSGGAGDVEIDRYRRLLYATDASIYEMEPVAVVYPRSTADVQHAMRVAGAHGVPVLPRGGGTSLSGQGVNHAIVLDFTLHMAGVLGIDAEGQTARVQPGVVLAELNKALRPHGLQYPIDPSTANRATIGGGVGNNSCGAHSGVYGKTVDNVVALEVVLADGSKAALEALNEDEAAERGGREGLEGDIYRGVRAIAREHRAEVEKRFPKILRRVSGYNLDEVGEEGPLNLAKLVVGSEGTLATVTEATVRVVPIPPVKMLTALHFRTVVEAAAATVRANGHGPSAVELVDDTIIERCRESAGFRSLVEFVEGEPGALLLVEFAGERVEEVEGKVGELRADLVGEEGAYAAVVAREAAEQQRMWRMREAGLGLLMSLRGDAKPASFVEDTAVAPERLAEYVARFDALVRARGLRPAYYGHASVGCLHIRPVVDLKDAEGLANAEGLAEEIADLVLEFGGSLSGEHGDGIVRGVFTERMFGPELTRAFRELKALWDPQGLLNPGKIVDTPPFADNLRLSPSTVNAELHTDLDFAFEGGLARAAEQCNGQGACRKLDGGMCPSFMVTGDEEHSTRGRANLLRQALNGALPLEDLTSERMHEALDLCVECKACKTECPSGVDFAKLKYEVQAQSSAAHGAPLRDRAFARIRRLSALASPVGPLANAVARLGPARALLERAGGIDRRRPLPAFASQRFGRWWSRRTASRGEAPRGEAVYLADTFTEYFHPEVGRAAVRVLEALGYAVTVVPKLECCGRPAISKGQLGLARGWAEANVARLEPYALQGVPIVGTEPSCLLTLRDEYRDLLPEGRAEVVAAQAVLLDELVARVAGEDEGISDAFAGGPGGEVLVHAHCHQKALAGAEPSLRALEAAGYAPSLVDSGCCGMAGSFGFEREHYEVSREMGAYRLFPAVEAAGGKVAVAVTGVSCRQQIGHFTSRTPRHVAELLAEALVAE